MCRKSLFEDTPTGGLFGSARSRVPGQGSTHPMLHRPVRRGNGLIGGGLAKPRPWDIADLVQVLGELKEQKGTSPPHFVGLLFLEHTQMTGGQGDD